MAAVTISFRTKVRDVYNADGTLSHRVVTVPEFKRSHIECMAAARSSRVFGGFANSDLFPAIMAQHLNAAFGLSPHSRTVRLHNLPPCIRVDTSGYLAEFSFTVADELRASPELYRTAGALPDHATQGGTL